MKPARSQIGLTSLVNNSLVVFYLGLFFKLSVRRDRVTSNANRVMQVQVLSGDCVTCSLIGKALVLFSTFTGLILMGVRRKSYFFGTNGCRFEPCPLVFNKMVGSSNGRALV